MKIIGLLGGTSWPSTPLYYDYLNRSVSTRLGGFHSARILLYSIDYHPIKTLYHHGWDDIPNILKEELLRLDQMGPDCILICNNTLHKAYDILAHQGLGLSAHVVHIAVATARKALAENYTRLLLLGTKFTMEDNFFSDRLKFFGLDVYVPSEAHRHIIQDIQAEISSGVIRPEHSERFKDLLLSYLDFDAVVLACTELPLVITQAETNLPILNTIKCQCDEALKFALA